MLNPNIHVTKETPPTFLVHAQDDPMDPVEFSFLYSAALKKVNVPVELHIYPHGGHAFGLRQTDQPITEWPRLVERWLKMIGVVESQKLKCAENEG